MVEERGWRHDVGFETRWMRVLRIRNHCFSNGAPTIVVIYARRRTFFSQEAVLRTYDLIPLKRALAFGVNPRAALLVMSMYRFRRSVPPDGILLERF